jgi:hypothetical protein
MKQTVTETMFIDAFQAIRPENFSLEGLRALFAHIEELETMGEEMELDVIALCCDFEEYPDALTVADVMDWGFDSEEEAFARLQSETTVIDFDGGIIIENF